MEGACCWRGGGGGTRVGYFLVAVPAAVLAALEVEDPMMSLCFGGGDVFDHISFS